MWNFNIAGETRGTKPFDITVTYISIFFILGPICRPGSPKTRSDCIDHFKVKGYNRVDETDRHSPSSWRRQDHTFRESIPVVDCSTGQQQIGPKRRLWTNIKGWKHVNNVFIFIHSALPHSVINQCYVSNVWGRVIKQCNVYTYYNYN